LILFAGRQQEIGDRRKRVYIGEERLEPVLSPEKGWQHPF
jgi:hypothetical protein